MSLAIAYSFVGTCDTRTAFHITPFAVAVSCVTSWFASQVSGSGTLPHLAKVLALFSCQIVVPLDGCLLGMDHLPLTSFVTRDLDSGGVKV